MQKIIEKFWWLIILLTGLVVFAHSLNNQFFADDYYQILGNPLLSNISNIPRLFLGSSFYDSGAGTLVGVYYKPLMTSVFAILVNLFGGNPLPFHLFQLLLAIGNAMLVYLLFRHFFKENISLFLSLLFLVHPINSEPVLYIASLQDTLFLFFGLLSILSLLREKLTTKNYLLFSLCLLLSFLSKETAILFLFTGASLRLFVYNKNFKPLIVLDAALLFIYLLIRKIAIGFVLKSAVMSAISYVSFSQRILNIPMNIFYYIRTFFYPWDLLGGLHQVISGVNWNEFYFPLFIDILTGLILTALAIWTWKKNKKGRSYLYFFIFWFCLGLGFHLQIIPFDQTTADRWFYFPAVGLIGIFGSFLQSLTKRDSKVLMITGIILLIFLSARTYKRTFDWESGLTFVKSVTQINPGNFYYQNGYGWELYKINDYNGAIYRFQIAINEAPWTWLPYNNLALVYRHLGAVQNNNTYIALSEENFTKSVDRMITLNSAAGNSGLFDNLFETEFNFEPPEKTIEVMQKYRPYTFFSNNDYFFLAASQYRIHENTEALATIQEGLSKFPNDEYLTRLQTLIQENQPIVITRPVF